MAPEQQLVSQLLKEWGAGSKQALDRLMPLVYDQLRTLAARCLASERPGHTLRATDLVNEAYVRLVHCEPDFNNRVHFFAVSARLLRRILVDHGRRQVPDQWPVDVHGNLLRHRIEPHVQHRRGHRQHGRPVPGQSNLQ